MSSPSPLRTRVLTCTVALALLVVGVAGPAGATPSGSTGSGSGSGTGSGTKDLGVLNEQYNLTRLRLARASAAVAATDARLDLIRAEATEVQDAVRERSARLYRGAGAEGVTSMLSVGDVNELARRSEYFGAAAKGDRDLLSDLSKTLKQLNTERAAQRNAEAQLRVEAESVAAARRKLMAEAAAAAKARIQQAAAGPIGTPRIMRGVTTSGSGTNAPAAPAGAPPATRPTPSTGAPSAPPSSPPSYTPPSASGRGAAVVAFARAQLGKPYVFATAGPATFDCSGLTKAAWASVGVSMDHYSGSQATHFPKVGWDQLQPGDIVVFYADFHHVGIYIGGGQMIHAPRTGDVVKIAPAWRTEFQFGVRPG